MTMFAIIGLLSIGDDPTPGLFIMIAALAIGGLLITRWLPSSTIKPPGPRPEEFEKVP